MSPHNKKDTEPGLQARVNLDRLPAKGRELQVVADEEQRAWLAQVSKVSAVGRFSASLRVSGIKGGVQVTGRLLAEITQPCVVSLEPVHQRIDEPLERVFLPLSARKDPGEEEGVERFVDLNEEELVDYYEGSELDLEDFLIEELGLAIDLYPRAPGAGMTPEQRGDDPAALSPFSVLKSLSDEKE